MQQPGSMFGGRYRLHERIGAGGMGEVWRASDEKLERQVALKIMHHALLEDPDFPKRFRAEARSLARVRHPGVVSVYDFDDRAVPPFLVMEHIAGEPLSTLLRRSGRLTAERTMNVVAQAADALQAAHDRGVIHRDVKPANILLGADDSVVLTDFGIARLLEGTRLTATGAVLGTLSYLAPEQVLGEPTTPRTDIYALGVVAFECLAGTRPFDRDNPAATMMARVREAPPTLPISVPPAVCAVLEPAMATDPANRWPSAADLARACEDAMTEAPVGVRPRIDTGRPQPVEGISPIAIALPGQPAGGYTLRAYLSEGTMPEETAVFLSRRGRLLLFGTAEALVSFVRSGQAHDLADLDGWTTLVASLEPDDVVRSPAGTYALDLVPAIAADLRRALDNGDALLLITAAELARELAQALGLEAVRAALAPGSMLDWLDRTLVAGYGVGDSSLHPYRRQLRGIGYRAGHAWNAVVQQICDVVEWRH